MSAISRPALVPRSSLARSRRGQLRRRAVGILVAGTLALPVAALSAPAEAAPPREVPCGQIELAPVLDDDRTDAGKKIKQRADRRGVYVPIIMVPDWHGRATHNRKRTGDFSATVDMGAGGPAPAAPRASLIGQLQQIPGAAVYTFDYRSSAGFWVDDPAIGPALSDAIDCVTNAVGQKAVLITHGTGGLAARYAVGGVVEGRDRGDKVATVIGYGTPQTGSQLAELLNNGVGSTASEPRTVLRLLLGACSALDPAEFATQAPCGFLPAQAKAFGRAGGEAFRGDSPQHQALRPFPGNVRVHAFAGDVSVAAPNLGWFGLRPFRSENVQLGDLVSSTASTTIQAVSQLRASCRFALEAYGSSAQSAALRLPEVGAPGAALPFPATARPCYSASLPRVSQFADRVTDIISTEIRGRQPLNITELESLEVPSICGQPAGQLVGGRLPNIPAGGGEVALASTLFPDRFEDFTSFGDLTGDGVADTVVVLKCSTAAGPGADVVAAYDSGADFLGSVDLSTITKLPINEIYEVEVSGGRALMQWRTTPSAQNTATTVDASASFTYSSSSGLTPGFVASYNETDPAGRLLDKVRDGKRGSGVRNLAPIEVVDAMIARHQITPLGDMTCYGPYPTDSSWPAAAVAEYGSSWPPADGFDHGDRFCLIEVGEDSFALLGMAHTGFRTWRAVEFLAPDVPTDDGEGDGEGDGGLFPFPGDPDDDEDFEDDDSDDDGGLPLFP